MRTGHDAIELLACGATHIALGTILFADVDAPRRVREELADELAHAGFGGPDDAIGAAHENVVQVANPL